MIIFLVKLTTAKSSAGQYGQIGPITTSSCFSAHSLSWLQVPVIYHPCFVNVHEYSSICDEHSTCSGFIFWNGVCSTISLPKKHCLPHFNHRKKNSQLLVRPTLRTPGKEQKSSKFDFIISTVDCWIKYDNMVKSIIVASFRSPKTLSKTPSLHGLRLRCHEGHEGRRRWLRHVLYLPNLHRNSPGQLLNW